MVISMFGCELPPAARRAMAPDPPGAAPNRRPPGWIALEYLSAEPWVEGAHGLPSIKPTDGARQWFVLPGFSEATAGLLREQDLLVRREQFRARNGPKHWLSTLGVPVQEPRLRISLFCYPHAPLATLLDAARAADEPNQLLVPEGVADPALRAYLGKDLGAGQAAQLGALQVVRLPWLSQDDYDRLLWSCDLNFVRGEDSWIRAVWAQAPFIWQPYWQRDDAHLQKLEAFLGLLLAQAPPDDAQAVRAAHRVWAGQDWPLQAPACASRATAPTPSSSTPEALARGSPGTSLWRALSTMAHSPSLAAHLQRFSAQLASRADLATRLCDWLERSRHAPAAGAKPKD
jgi:uncharacterized repeat protein (TIGR03837 family)